MHLCNTTDRYIAVFREVENRSALSNSKLSWIPRQEAGRILLWVEFWATVLVG